MADSIRILHVDDEADFVEVAATFLEREDERFAVETATSANEGLDRLDEERFDCVVSDYEMPDVNGIDFLETVRVDYPDLPFILYTGKGSEEVASAAVSSGATDYLQKDVGVDQYTVLANRIGNAVSAYRTQRRLRETEAKLTEIADLSRETIFRLVDGEFEFVSPAVESLLGYAPDDLVGTDVQSRVAESSTPAVSEALGDLRDGEERRELPVTFVDADGEQVEAEVSATRVRDGASGVTVLGFARESPDRTASRGTVDRQAALLDNSPDTFYILDEDGSVIYQNQAPAEATAYEQRDLRDVFPSAFIHPDDQAAVRRDFAYLLEHPDEVVTTEYRFETPGGEWRWAENRAINKLDNSTIGGVVVVHRDVTERRRREQTLERLTHRLEALNRATRHLWAAESREEVATIGVEVAAEVLGLEMSAIHLKEDGERLVPVAATDAVYDLIGEPPTFTPGNSIAWRTFERGEPIALDNLHEDDDAYDPDSPIHSEVQIPIVDRGILMAGSPTPAAFDEQDVLLGELLAGNVATALEHVERTAELRQRERDLTRQNDRLEEFTRVVSHDLRNPLNVAAGHLDLARDDGDSDHLDGIERAHDRMATLIEDLLALAREGETSTELTPVDLSTYVERCWQTVDTREATLAADVDATVRADDGRLKQLFENLFRNAVEHGGEDVTVTVGLLDGGFFVADDGPGIPPSERERVLEAGYSTQQDGTGFGLSIVRQVAEGHGWDVRVTESAEGGARFELRDVEFVDEE